MNGGQAFRKVLGPAELRLDDHLAGLVDIAPGAGSTGLAGACLKSGRGGLGRGRGGLDERARGGWRVGGLIVAGACSENKNAQDKEQSEIQQ